MLIQILTVTIVKWQNYEKMEKLFKDFKHSIDALEKNLKIVNEDVKVLEKRIKDPEGINRITKDEIVNYLEAVSARIKAVETSLHRLQFLQKQTMTAAGPVGNAV